MARGNDYYSLEANNEKNRIYFSMTGSIPNVDAIPNFLQDWKDSVVEVKSGFSILGDLSRLNPLPKDVDKLNEETQVWLMQNGCGKVAQLVGDIGVMAQVNEFAERSGMRSVLRAFNFYRTAELWLDIDDN